ncbi:MAG: hypothetical protein FWD64_00700 [Acidobacteriaceae bacterium]|nr:hypothetical protein [Acidobacteriaceae bacterium]
MCVTDFGIFCGLPADKGFYRIDAAFPAFSVPPNTNSTFAGTGNYSTSVNLFVDSINYPFPVPGDPGSASTAVYADVVYVTAAAV